jgi:hypothetical protein
MLSGERVRESELVRSRSIPTRSITFREPCTVPTPQIKP